MKLIILLLISGTAFGQNMTIKIGSGNITSLASIDTTNKWMNFTGSNAGGDSLITFKNNVRTAYKYPTAAGSFINNSRSLQSSSDFYITGMGRSDSLRANRLLIGNLSNIGDDVGGTPTRIFLNMFDSGSLVTADGNLAVYGAGVFPEINKSASGVDNYGFIIGVGSESRIGPRNTQNWSSAIGSTALRGSVNIQVGALGTLTNGHSVMAASDIGGMTVRNLYGNYVATPYVHAGGSVTEAWGMYIESQSVGTYASHGIVQAGAEPNYFVGAIGSGVNSDPNIRAQLDIVSTTKGALLPRMTTAQRNAIPSPPTGLELFCTDCTATDASTGVKQCYNGSAWKNYW